MRWLFLVILSISLVNAQIESCPLNGYLVSTLVGGLQNPYDGAFDSSGNLFVTSMLASNIRKITPLGIVTVYAVPVTLPKISGPNGILIDTFGNIYFNEFTGNRVRMINTSTPKFISIVAGQFNGTSGYLDGVGAAAMFNGPSGIVTDNSGNLFIADSLNQLIRMVKIPLGNTSTLAGTYNIAGYLDGAGTSAMFNNPRGLAFDLSGNLFVSDKDNHAIRQVTINGLVTTYAGSSVGPTFSSGLIDGQGTLARFNQPVGLSTDLFGNLFVAEEGNQAIRKINATGLFSYFNRRLCNYHCWKPV